MKNSQLKLNIMNVGATTESRYRRGVRKRERGEQMDYKNANVLLYNWFNAGDRLN